MCICYNKHFFKTKMFHLQKWQVSCYTPTYPQWPPLHNGQFLLSTRWWLQRVLTWCKWNDQRKCCYVCIFCVISTWIQNQDCLTDGATEERELVCVWVASGAVMITCEWRCCLIGNTRTSSPLKRLSSSASVRKNTCYQLHINLLVVVVKAFTLVKNSIQLNPPSAHLHNTDSISITQKPPQ